MKIKYGGAYHITFRDSLLLLNSSLAKLCHSFNVEKRERYFPYDFVNKNNLSYSGVIPEYSYFDINKVSQSDYDYYCSRFTNNEWSLKK